ncbi:carboxypeptidase-like regulatory domain-containing protein [Aquiflexum gelatinilyticum]|uniref:Carboxypeptidase-like regulatory domain-containing protein n=1 Tax=Aquiflexum gelatinilyticum TaxID=2961943 RepID=A0A9X2T180_9BACT|nr:carboxypeptidase-like regulatory domain-containing protein [Aquiflexum gelatinilyticum]MCR9016458.1 carboxypeptidase-like regulatory domain-containing protein [Aquiflexum gelatinilyticum]
MIMKFAFPNKLAKLTLLILGMIVYGFLEAQVISGKVVDEKTGEALPFANVFINNTTLGSTTDIDGNFKISGSLPQNPEVVASFIGYFTKYRKVAFGGRNQVTVNFELTPKEDQLDEVSLSAKRDKAWERNLRKFERVFLAVPDDPFFKKNEILNPWVIDFEEGKAEGLGRYLAASSSEPITVANRALGYEIDYHLQEYLQTKNGFQYYGLVNFGEIETPPNADEQNWNESRNSAFFGSMRHLLYSLVRNEADSQGFEAFIVQNIASTQRTNDFDQEIGSSLLPLPLDSLVTAILPNGNFIMEWPGNVEVHFTKKYWPSTYYTNRSHPISWINAPNCRFEVDANGVLMDPRELILSGYVARERVARSLPHDFRPDLEDLKLLAEVDSSQIDRDKWNNLREKPYLTFNKPYYSPGETVWFSSRMIYQNSIFQDSLSRVLYVELLNDNKESVLIESFPIAMGLAKGQLQLPAGITPGNYTIRAYTNWMRNFPETDFFYKPLPLISEDREVLTSEGILTYDQSLEDIYLKLDTEITREELSNKASIGLSILDSDSTLLEGNFSISLIDADLATFIGEQHTIETAIDWIGTELAEYDFPEEKHNIEFGISLEGYFSDKKNKPLAVPLTVVLGEMEDFGIIKSDSTGYFWATGLSFTDSAEVAIAALNINRKSFGEVSISEKIRPSVSADLPKLQLETRSKSKMGQLDILDGDYFELEEFVLEDQKKETLEDKNYGYGPGDRSIGSEFLDRFPQLTLDGIVSMNMPGGGMGNYNWGLNAGEPLLIIDGNRYFTDAGETTNDVLRTFIAAEVESVEVYTFNAAQFGMAGFAGVIMVKTKKGSRNQENADRVFNSDEFQIFKMRGYTPVKEFPVQKVGSDIPESRPTIYWNPAAQTDSENETFNFSVNIPKSTKNMLLKIEGISSDGLPFYRVFEIPVN